MKLLMMESWRLLRCRLLIGWKEDNRTWRSSSGNIRGRRQVDAPSEARVRTDKPDVLKPLVSWRVNSRCADHRTGWRLAVGKPSATFEELRPCHRGGGTFVASAAYTWRKPRGLQSRKWNSLLKTGRVKRNEPRAPPSTFCSQKSRPSLRGFFPSIRSVS